MDPQSVLVDAGNGAVAEFRVRDAIAYGEDGTTWLHCNPLPRNARSAVPTLRASFSASELGGKGAPLGLPGSVRRPKGKKPNPPDGQGVHGGWRGLRGFSSFLFRSSFRNAALPLKVGGAAAQPLIFWRRRFSFEIEQPPKPFILLGLAAVTTACGAHRFSRPHSIF
jgi:hypothetical protein